MKRGLTFGSGVEDRYGLQVARAGMLEGLLDSLDETARRHLRHDLISDAPFKTLFFEVPISDCLFPVRGGQEVPSHADAIRFEFTRSEVLTMFAAKFGAAS